MDGTRQRARDVLGAGRLMTPLDVWLGPDDGVAVGEVGLDRHLGAHLLAGRDDKRRLVGLSVEDAADGVPDARGGVQIDVDGTAGGLSVAIGHPDHDELLEAKYVGEVLREIRQHRQLRRAGVAEDGRHVMGAEQLKRRITYRGHQISSFLLFSVCGRLTRRRSPRLGSAD